MATLDDDLTIGGSTWASQATLVISEDGTCPRHPHVRLRETGPDGYVYQKESCDECEQDFKKQKESLQERKKELDQQLMELKADGGAQQEVQDAQEFSAQASAATNGDGMTRRGRTDEDAAFPPMSSMMNTTTTNDMTLQQTLASQMQMMQQMQNYMLREKETETKALRQKVEIQQQLLVTKEVEIALLKEKLSRQEERMQQELKLLKLASLNQQSSNNGSSRSGRSKGNKEIHIQELHVSVGGNGAVESLDPQVVKAATQAATQAAIDRVEAESSSSPPTQITTQTPPKPYHSRSIMGESTGESQAPKLGYGGGSSSNSSSQQDLTMTFGNEAPTHELKAVPGTTPPQPPQVMRNISNDNDDDHSDDEDHLDTLTPLPTTGMSRNKDPMHASLTSLQSSSSVPREVADAGSIDPTLLKEDVTLGTTSLDDLASVGNTIASSTYGEDRQKVVSQTLLDPYGDKGRYSGIVLRSTGMPHGLGRMVYEDDGRTYEGDWRHGRWHGYGTATFANGDSYEGEYRYDQRHGRGKYGWNDGRIYDGEFSEDKRHGKGKFKWPDGATYEGDFHQGQREGRGKYTFSDGGYYIGSWIDGRYEGFGECHWEDGRTYKGEWKSGMAHGQGVETYPDGRVRHDGQWNNDEPVRD